MRLLNRLLGRPPEHEGPIEFQEGARLAAGVVTGLGVLAVAGGLVAGSLGFEGAGIVVGAGMGVSTIGAVVLMASLMSNEHGM